MRHPDMPPELRGTYAGLGHEAAIAHLLDLGVTAVELLPVHQNVPEAFLVQRGADELLGLQHDRVLRPAQRLLRRGAGRAARAARSPSSRRWWTRCTRPGLEVILDVVFNHTAEGRAGRPDAVLPRPGQPRLLPARSRRPRRLLRHDRLRQLAERRRPDDAAADHGLAALLADRDARRRLPVRPGAHPGPPGRRLRQVLGLLRHVLPGPGGVPGQADRRTVGRRPDGQLRPGPVPAAVARMERQVPRHHARLLAQPPGRASASSPPGSAGSSDLYGTRSAGGPPPRSTSSPSTTASPCATWSPTTTSTTRPTARTTATGPATTIPGTAAPRARPTTPTCWRCARASPGPC